MLHHDLKRLKKRVVKNKIINADLIIADSVRAYSSALSLINMSDAPVLVFDSPILLYKHENITMLDCPADANLLKYEFNGNPLDYTTLLAAIKTKQKIVLNRNRADLINEILKSYTASSLLDKFNTFLYANTTPVHRMAVKTALVQYIFGTLKLDGLKKTLEKYIKFNPKNLATLQPIIDYMESAAGAAMQKALAHAQKMENEASKNTKRKIAYKKLADMYSVNQFELNNIILLYRGIK